jgi:DNA-binding winged helix-turn-helix (wHTH) protein/tetratricopeptide (TPR) repeat protein
VQYRWNDYCLDLDGALLTHCGEQIDLTRKQLDCISHLIEHRHRVVSYDELIRQVWGHDNVTNHQLAQLVLALRRMLGDDGRAQRMIRTIPGMGYRWVGVIIESKEPACKALTSTSGTSSLTHLATVEVPAGDSIAASSPEAVAVTDALAETSTTGANKRHPALWIAWSAASLLAFSGAAIYGRMQNEPASPIAPPASTAIADPVTALEPLLDIGRYEDLRQGLAQLPPNLADSPRARLLEAQLDIARGRRTIALQKLEEQQARAFASRDVLFQARIMTLKSRVYFNDDQPPEKIIAAAQSSLDLLASMGNAAPLEDVGDAILVRGIGLAQDGRWQEAMRDYAKARDIFLSAGDLYGVEAARANLARVWVRAGQLHKALRELEEIPRTSAVLQVNSLNTISRIKAELLDWDAALAVNDQALALLRGTPESFRRHRTLMARAFILIEKGRLREAAAQLEESRESAPSDETASPVVEAMYEIASGKPASAMERLQQGMDAIPQNRNFQAMLQDRESALMLWTLAARDLAGQGKPVAAPSAVAKAIMLKPMTPNGHIARGRWRWMQGDAKGAEADFRLAVEETQIKSHGYRMTLAAEALIDLLLQRGDADGARAVLEDMQAHLSTYADRDYRTSLLALRVAVALKDPARAQAAYQRNRSLAGERGLPVELAKAYAQLILASGPTTTNTAALRHHIAPGQLD